MKKYRGHKSEERYHMTPHRTFVGTKLVGMGNHATAPSSEPDLIPRIKTRRRPGTTDFIVIRPRRKATRAQIRAGGKKKAETPTKGKKK